MASVFGIPVSTTHTINGDMGVGSLKRNERRPLGHCGNIVWAWIITIPCSAAISASLISLQKWLVRKGHRLNYRLSFEICPPAMADSKNKGPHDSHSVNFRRFFQQVAFL